ncbi:hypothetical protein SKAU_G00166350 [Synaphobranchus kaupii]|uniref:Uncharacterized protein n=1 Tax=Synaphobranchus kaupii TaxID=118154 RepID=A0A9Q1FK29_SYNKA|nr:hypothetical protein SKAU_G00166350 [Synaphobranchus kaupii]
MKRRLLFLCLKWEGVRMAEMAMGSETLLHQNRTGCDSLRMGHGGCAGEAKRGPRGPASTLTHPGIQTPGRGEMSDRNEPLFIRAPERSAL